MWSILRNRRERMALCACFEEQLEHYKEELHHAFDTDRDGALAPLARVVSCELHRGLRARSARQLDVAKVLACLEGGLGLKESRALSSCLRFVGARYSIPVCGAAAVLIHEYISAYKAVRWRSLVAKLVKSSSKKRKLNALQ